MFNWLNKKRSRLDVRDQVAALPAARAAMIAQAVEALNAGDLAKAAQLYLQVLSADPGDAKLRVALSVALIGQALYAEAKTHLNRAILQAPGNADAYYFLGRIARQQGDLPGAIALYNEALDLKPDFEAAFNDLAATHLAAGDKELAERVLLRAVSVCNQSAVLQFELGVLYANKNQFARAEACYRCALLIQPGFGEAHRNLGVALQSQGRIAEAIISFEHAISSEPGLLAAHSNLLWMLSFDRAQFAERYLPEARRYGAKALAIAKPYVDWLSRSHASDVQSGQRRLRVGLVSGDLWLHPVGIFLEGVLGNLSQEKLELVAYSMNQKDDGLTARIKGFFSGWTSIAGMGDQEAASRIHADRIDILIDLAGHSGRNRLTLFAWKPAPVQVSWLGYLASTGVPGMDFVLADPVAAAGGVPNQFTEKIWHLPETFNCFTPPTAHPNLEVAPLPALRNGYISFGSFQRINKLGEATLALWASVLHAVPQARLYLRNGEMDFPAARDALLARLAQAGIAADRVSLAGRLPLREDVFAAYAEIDIVLDTISYPGTTTTCEALWMGVPTLTLAGDTLLGRVGASLLTCAGLHDWVAKSEDGYLALAVKHAADVKSLAKLRGRLRQQVAATALFDAARFAPQLQEALFAMWRQKMGGAVLAGGTAALYSPQPVSQNAEAQAWYRRGTAALEQNDLPAAIAHFNRAVAANPAFELALRDLSRALFQSGQQDAAKQAILKGVLEFPQSADFHYYLGNIYAAEKQYQQAISAWEEALRHAPDYAQVHFNIGHTLIAARCSEQALPSLDRALALDPEHVDAHNNRGNALLTLKRFDEALESYQNALRLHSDNAGTLYNIGCVQMELGAMSNAIANFRRALALKPDYPQAHNSLLWALSFSQEDTATEYVQEARAYGKRVAARAVPYRRWTLNPEVNLPKPLKVGIVSGDLRVHPVGYFFAGVLAKLDPAKVKLVAYSMNPYDDELTVSIKAACSEWTSIAELGDEEAARKIHEDGVEILVDLAGHTNHNRLPLFAWKPAPVQVSWLGYLASTGVPGMDYVLADPVSAPVALQQQFTEEIWHLPGTFNCFAPPVEFLAPEVAPSPAQRNGYVTFGSFQRANKLTDATLTMWARILRALPKCRLRLQNAQNDNLPARLTLQARLASLGVPPGQCIFVGAIEKRELHLAAHAEVDIVLDTYPYPGTTTTCEALWMGVPTVTLGGNTMLARVGASLLMCAGLQDWIAWSEDDYVNLAIHRASDTASLACLRTRLREQVSDTPLFNSRHFAMNLENAFLAMWSRKMNIN